ncbi:MAG: GMC family oxidoreductase [Cyanobacteria bacterium NC_groundwater_1444_Ag_S-0.65um_54_12]|nr:GMC family oxidoreductase [Cyanobacteria bacterium NC_groundwater_1444_Ag_S-0.65um_54_12]
MSPRPLFRPQESATLPERWLTNQGVAPPTHGALLSAARERVTHFPRFQRWLYPLASGLVEWLGPMLGLNKFGRASRLTDSQFEQLEVALADHPSPIVRACFLLFRLPLLEQLVPEQAPLPLHHPLLESTSQSAGSRAESVILTSGGFPVIFGSSSEPDSYFDVLVIGSGAGGAPLAWSLAQNGVRVAIIEAGQLATPATSAAAIEHYYLKQGFVFSLAGGLFPIFAGSTVGGTTTINSGTCLRPAPESLVQWDRLAGTDFSTGTLEPWLDLAEQLLGVATPPRSLLGPSALLLERGLERLGRSGTYVLPRSAPHCQGSGRCCFVCRTGAKMSTDRAFLPATMAAGGTLLAQTRAIRIKERKELVLVDTGGALGNRRLRCRQLVLAAGALGTPGLIWWNRLGSAWYRAGQQLQVHPAVKVFAHFPEPVNGDRGIPQGLGYRDPTLPRISFEGIFVPACSAAKMLSLAGQRARWWLEQYPQVASFGMYVQDRSRGQVFLLGDLPLIWYHLDTEDARDLGRGILLLAEAWLAAGADRVLLPAFGIANELTEVSELTGLRPEDFRPECLLAGAFHPQGTAGIGRVVNSDLTIIGSQRVHVADASVLPDSPGVNPQITIMALALRLADKLLKQLPH